MVDLKMSYVSALNMLRVRRGSWQYCGTFLISFALLSFEISTIRTINFVLGPSFVYSAIALAMLGLSAAGSILSLGKCQEWPFSRERVLLAVSMAIAVLLIACHFMAANIKQDLNEAIEIAGRTGGLNGIVPALVLENLKAVLKLGLVLSIPYFLFGVLIAYLFSSAGREEYGRLYAADLIGAALGCVGAIVFMEITDYATSVSTPVVFAALAGSAYAASESRRLALLSLATAAVVSVLPWVTWYSEGIEPDADPHYLVRDYSYEFNVVERWHAWNSFTRVGAVETTEGERDYATLSLANGDGMAWLWPYVPDRAQPLRHGAVTPALFLDPPKDVLVLLAGAGADLMSLHEHGAGRVVGVELNQLMVDGGIALTKYRLPEFLAKESVNLNVSEGRVFLERDQQRYDVIVYSWGGATAAYYAGTLGGTTQFLYTYEGLSAAFDHLKPGGYALIQSINKVKALAAIRQYLGARGLEDAAQTAIVLFHPERSNIKWNGVWDENPLLFKPGGWSDTEIARIVSGAADEGLQVAYAPGIPGHPAFEVYERILKASDVEAELSDIRSKTKLRFEIVSDNRPFYLDLFYNDLYFRLDFWLGLFDLDRLRSLNSYGSVYPFQAFQLVKVWFVLIVAVAALLLTILPLFLRKGPPPTLRTWSFHVYFFCLGAGFMLAEIALMHKASLLFGHPGIAIAIVLGSMIFFAGVGSCMSNWTFRHRITIGAIAAVVASYVISLSVLLGPLLEASLAWPVISKGLLIAAVVAPGAILMGHLFPQGIALAAKDDIALVPWAWGINGATSTIAAGFAPLSAQAWGFHTLFIIAAGLYGLIAVLSLCNRRWNTVG